MNKLSLNIIGIGKALPKNCVTSEALDEQLGLPSGKMFRQTGLKQRHFLGKDESADDLQRRAIDEALRNANLSINDIDCVINASGTMRQAIPFNAANTARLLKTEKPLSCFDVNMTCLSALRALELCDYLLPRYRRILLVSCEIASVGLNWDNLHESGIFGDGAAAMVVTGAHSRRGGILSAHFAQLPEGYDYCAITGGGHRNHPSTFIGDYKTQGHFHMDGKKLYRLVAKEMPVFLRDTIAPTGLNWSDIDWVVPHQASRFSLDHIVKFLDISKDKVIDIFNEHGNQIAASIPTALYHLFHDKPIKSGDKVLLAGTSAGVGLGAMIWEKP